MNSQEREERRVQRERALFDAIPLPAFMVDAQLRVHNFNLAAEPFIGHEAHLAIARPGGEVWHCIHSEREGCGLSEVCQDCVIRDSVRNAMRAGSTWRQRHKAQLRDGTSVRDAEFLVTASFLPYTDPPQVVLLLEEVTEHDRLRARIPFCRSCKKVQDDSGRWKSPRRFLEQALGATLAESVCPSCAAKAKSKR